MAKINQYTIIFNDRMEKDGWISKHLAADKRFLSDYLRLLVEQDLRVDNNLLEEFKQAARANNADYNELLSAYMDYYCKQKGVQK